MLGIVVQANHKLLASTTSNMHAYTLLRNWALNDSGRKMAKKGIHAHGLRQQSEGLHYIVNDKACYHCVCTMHFELPPAKENRPLK